ncbi:hypothetical protein BAU15_00065 [Enterococcus sp. JM4C]|uniref:MFS transporter n=1 Tax=Candidatus Enterococcus huntleyi TaxID=1857217 RepID=UPI00137B81BE|nr:MFS transporter [Enterococcus sp. JM4C]KAF1299076.1 hypothetical protein BAU15_00065 [Enterococcus sp. JM4C]
MATVNVSEQNEINVEKISQPSEVEYRRAKNWEIILSQFNNASAMVFYTLVGLMSYVGNEGYGIVMAVMGMILTVSRVFDGLIDPFLAIMIDSINTRFGKLRILLAVGWVIRSVAVLMLFTWGSGAGHGMIYFITFYVLYIIGSSVFDITGNMIPTILTNDPKQRPAVQVWSTVFSYAVPTALSLIMVMVMLPRFNNQYSVEMLKATAVLFILISLVFTTLCIIGVMKIDKAENFVGIRASGEETSVNLKDMLALFKENRPFQMYIVSSVAAKLAQQTTSQAIVTTLMFGILIGNIQIGTIINTVSMLPAILFAIVGARYAGKFGNKAATVTWTRICIVLSVVSVLFLVAIDMRSIATNTVLMVVFFALLLLTNGTKMVVTIANGAMRSDIIDFELDKSGRFMPAVVTASYNFIDQLVTSLGTTIAALAVSLIGYTTVSPQPTDAPTPAIKWMTLFLFYGIPIIGWLIGLVAMKYYDLSREEMVNVQSRIHDKKQALKEKAE